MRASTLWLAALAFDAIAGEPPAAIHPVVAAGRLMTVLEGGTTSKTPTAATQRGLMLVIAPSVVALSTGWLVPRVRPSWLSAAASIWLLKSSFALRELLDAAARAELALAEGDLKSARHELRALVSREVDALDDAHLTSAVIESLAENLADSYIAPLFWFAVGGLPAALAYRVVNTADAMVGYHGTYEHLGKPAARIDDLANLLPARLAAASLVVAAPLAACSARAAADGSWREHARTESPNAGWPMATAAGALGVWLEKPAAYRLGDGGRSPTPPDAAVARRLVLLAAAVATLVFVVLDVRHG